MAKSKNGGSRAMIRGRIGSDVYSVGKDGNGNRQQVIRSLAVQVSNPRTSSQMVGRMIMSTVMQGVSALRPIIDHSFDGVAKGQPSISKFISENYNTFKERYNTTGAGHKECRFNDYQEKGIWGNPWLISDGSVPLLDRNLISGMNGGLISFRFNLAQLASGGSLKAKEIKDQWPISADGYITLLGFKSQETNEGLFVYSRIKLNTAIADTTVITADNVDSLFITEGNVTPYCKLTMPTTSDDGILYLQLLKDTDLSNFGDDWNNVGYIVSLPSNGGWEHSRCFLSDFDQQDFVYFKPNSQVLATYPIGTEQFLNGGDL
jgi:hypothetical protein